MVTLNIELPDGFLNEEVRCGYNISREMKEIWAVELDLLSELLRVCKKYNIKIFASGGTMLGAVRHHGFIPWDDDIDMMMFREDYTRLCEIADKEFIQPYFFQTEYTDPGSLRGHAQLRNSNTTAILNNDMGKYKFNQGIFIDIFPLDVVTDNKDDFYKQGQLANKYKRMARRYASCSTRFHKEKPSIKYYAKSLIYHMFSGPCEKKEVDMYKKFEEVCQMYNDINSEYVSTLSFQFLNKQHIKYKNDFEELIEMPFEFFEIPVGKNYDHALKRRYGDYKNYKIGVNDHGEVYQDVNRPYTDIITKINS